MQLGNTRAMETSTARARQGAGPEPPRAVADDAPDRRRRPSGQVAKKLRDHSYALQIP